MRASVAAWAAVIAASTALWSAGSVGRLASLLFASISILIDSAVSDPPPTSDTLASKLSLISLPILPAVAIDAKS